MSEYQLGRGGNQMGNGIGAWEIGRRSARVVDALALPAVIAWPFLAFLGGNSLVVWVVSGLLVVWALRRVVRAADWYAPYRMRFLSVVVIACAVSVSSAVIHHAFS